MSFQNVIINGLDNNNYKPVSVDNDGKLNVNADIELTNISVDNFPETQPVSGTVSVDNNVLVRPINTYVPITASTTDSMQGVTLMLNREGNTVSYFPPQLDDNNKLLVNCNDSTVSVNNFPETQPVSGTVTVDNLPATQPVSGTVTVDNLPATQPVSGTVTVDNLPDTQTVDGSVSVTNEFALESTQTTINNNILTTNLNLGLINSNIGLIKDDLNLIGEYNSTLPTLGNGDSSKLSLGPDGSGLVRNRCISHAYPDGVDNTQESPISCSGSYVTYPSINYMYNGSTWDRLRGDATNGLLCQTQPIIREYRRNGNCYMAHATASSNVTNARLYSVYNSETATDNIYIYNIELEISAPGNITAPNNVNCYIQAFNSITFIPDSPNPLGVHSKLNLQGPITQSGFPSDSDLKIMDDTNYDSREARGYIIFTDISNGPGRVDREIDFTNELIKIGPGQGFLVGYSNNQGGDTVFCNLKMKYIRTSDDL